MNLKLTILCENTVGRPGRLIGEHGFACFVETPGGAYLFDTGQGIGIVRNAQILGKDLGSLEGIVLSHGHYDHAGGLLDVLTQSGPVEVVAHPGIFARRYWVSEHERRYIGIPHRQPLLESMGARFRYETGFVELSPGIFLSGEVPRKTPFEKGDPHLLVEAVDGGNLSPDLFPDDYSLAFATSSGLVVLLGCAHAGMINILSHFVEKTGIDRIHAVVGGTHLGPADEDQFVQTLHALKGFGVERLGVSHCTGQTRIARLQSEFDGRFLFCSVGSKFEA